jgi:hypothetical protein
MSKLGQASIIVSIIIIVCGGLWTRKQGASDEEPTVRRQLNRLLAEFNGATTDRVDATVRAARIGQFFTSQVVVDLRKGSSRIHGRDELTRIAAQMLPGTTAYVGRLADLQVHLVDPDKAEATFTLLIRPRSVSADEPSIQAMEVSAEIRKVDGVWRVSQARAVDTLR